MRYKYLVSLLLFVSLLLSLVPLSLSAEGPPTSLGSIEAGEVDFNNPSDAVQPMYYDDGNLYVSPSSDYVKVGSTTSVYIECYDAYLTEVSSSNTDVATINSNGVILGVSPGVATITIEAYDYTNSDYHGYSFRVMVYDLFGLQSLEDYFIHSHNNSHHLLARNTAGSGPAAEEPATEVDKADGVTDDHWQLLQHSDGKYSIRFGTKALTVSSTNLVLSEYTGSYNQKFTIYRISDVNHKHYGGFVIRYGNYYVGINSSNQLRLIPHNPSTSDLEDNNGYFWSFIKKDRGTATMLGLDYTYVDSNGVSDALHTVVNFPYFRTGFGALGYTVQTLNTPSTNSAFSSLQTSEVFLYMGHGNPGRLSLCNSSGWQDRIYAHSSLGSSPYAISNLNDNALADSRYILYLACYTALSDRSYDLLSETYKKGAHFVAGSTHKIYSDKTNEFAKKFSEIVAARLNSSQQNMRLGECIDATIVALGTNVPMNPLNADGTVGAKTHGAFPLLYIGDGYQSVGIS